MVKHNGHKAMNVFDDTSVSTVVKIPKVLQCKVKKTMMQHGFSADFIVERVLSEKGSYHCVQLRSDSGKCFFLKFSFKKMEYCNVFQEEKWDLEWLKEFNVLTPYVVSCLDEEGYSFILMEYIEDFRENNKQHWFNLGCCIANMHKLHASDFGHDYHNHLGFCFQNNSKDTNWCRFFLKRRLYFQIDLAKKNKRWNVFLEKAWVQVHDVIVEELNGMQESPSLLHGDFWYHNYLQNKDGQIVLIDPAIYYGHREVDLAGFEVYAPLSNDFYQAYNQIFPLQKGYETRFLIYGLYPLLYHLNFVGYQYADVVLERLNQLARRKGGC